MLKNFIALFLFSQARLGHTRSLGARRGSAVVSMPGDHYQMDLHVLERDPTGIRILAVFIIIIIIIIITIFLLLQSSILW